MVLYVVESQTIACGLTSVRGKRAWVALTKREGENRTTDNARAEAEKEVARLLS
jgi:hypothetical protein